MLVKKLGIILVFKLKLYKLIKLLTLPLIVLVFVLPFTQWNFSQAKEKYQFQEPSLRTKVFDLDYTKSQILEPINYQNVSIGTKAIVFQGMLPNQCILLTFPQNLAQSFPIHMLYQTLKNDKALSKNVVLLSYQNIQNLKDLFKGFIKGNISLNFGVIRVALNIENQLRNKQKSKSTELKAFFQIYRKSGVHIDVDHFQSIKELFERLHIEWSPCEEIHETQELKILKKGVLMGAQYLGTSRSRLSLFMDHVLCQGYQSTWSPYKKGHEVMMEYGFQSSSLTFLTSNPLTTNDIKVSQSSQKIAKLAYSFAKEFSMQQDHLHSSTTLFYPIDNHYFISLVGTVYSGVILLLVGAVHVLGYIVENSQNLRSTITLINLIEMVLFWIDFRTNEDLNLTLGYLILKFTFKMTGSLFLVFKKIETPYISMQYFYCCALQILLSVYLSVFNFSLFYSCAILSCLSLIRTKRIISILVLGVLLMWISANIDTIKSQILLINFSNFVEDAQKLFLQFINLIKSLSLQTKIIMLPFLYGTSTFLN